MLIVETAREEAASDAVEVIEVAEASLDHGEQMLAIARQKAPRLASIEGRKLLRQQPLRLRLVIIRVGDEMDLDALSVAAHYVARARTTNERNVCERIDRRAGQGSTIAGTHSERT